MKPRWVVYALLVATSAIMLATIPTSEWLFVQKDHFPRIFLGHVISSLVLAGLAVLLVQRKERNHQAVVYGFIVLLNFNWAWCVHFVSSPMNVPVSIIIGLMSIAAHPLILTWLDDIYNMPGLTKK